MSASAPQISGGGILGKEVRDVRRQLDTFPRPFSTSEVTYTSDEVTSLCPITGQPDFYTVEITLADTDVLLESKSLKLYLQSYRDEGLFCEAFSDAVCEAVALKVTEGLVTVVVTQKPRGGVAIVATSWRTVRTVEVPDA